ncbi:MAG: hypothetical protein KKA10_17615 [Euryarchaeota archaeon]|nr:hypothetical protein [Euryarchaeota archaeon]
MKGQEKMNCPVCETQMNEEVKTIEQAEEIELKACQALEIPVNENDVKEIEYEKQKGKWEVEIV